MINWFTLTLLSVFCLTVFYFATKKLLNDHNNPRLYGGMMQVFTGTIGLILAFFTGFRFEFTPHTLLILFFEGVTYAVAASMYYTGLQKVDVSFSIILESTTVLWSLLIGFIALHEQITLMKLIGTICIFSAVLIISFKKKQMFRFTKYELIILASSILYALGAIIDKYLNSYSNPISYIGISFIVPGTMILLSNAPKLSTVGLQMLRKSSYRKLLLLSSAFVALSYFFLFTAYSIGGEATKVYPVSQIQTVIIAIIGIFLLKERTDISKKIFAAVVTCIGLIFFNI